MPQLGTRAFATSRPKCFHQCREPFAPRGTNRAFGVEVVVLALLEARFAHRAFWAAAMRARTAAQRRRLGRASPELAGGDVR